MFVFGTASASGVLIGLQRRLLHARSVRWQALERAMPSRYERCRYDDAIDEQAQRVRGHACPGSTSAKRVRQREYSTADGTGRCHEDDDGKHPHARISVHGGEAVHEEGSSYGSEECPERKRWEAWVGHILAGHDLRLVVDVRSVERYVVPQPHAGQRLNRPPPYVQSQTSERAA